MTSKTQLQSKIQELEQELNSFKEQLGSYKEKTIENASVGDTLEDGCIVVQKSNGLALLVAPQSTEVESTWSEEFPEVFAQLKEHGFNPSQFFIPTKEQLKLACKVIRNSFSPTFYWSSTEDNATNACTVDFNNGGAHGNTKPSTFCVRAFRCVNY